MRSLLRVRFLAMFVFAGFALGCGNSDSKIQMKNFKEIPNASTEASKVLVGKGGAKKEMPNEGEGGGLPPPR